jgi:DNA-binding MarR family transcriptional regulator
VTLFSGLITSKMRVRILMRLFQNPDQQTYLRELADEFGASPSQVRDELRRLHEAGLLRQRRAGRQVFYSANPGHALFPELQSIVRKALGMDRILDSIVERLGNLDRAVLLDDYAQGKDTGIIDLVLVGDVNRTNLDDIVAKTERYIGRKIRTLVLDRDEYARLRPQLGRRPQLVLWRCADG